MGAATEPAVGKTPRGGDSIDLGTDHDLRGASLAGQDLSEEKLAGRDLSGADLSEANLQGCNLIGAKLRGAILYRAQLAGCELLGADLREAHMDECRGERAGFGGADLRGARLSQAQLPGATFSQAKLAGADLRCAELSGARLCDADLTGAHADRASLQGADLAGATVTGASFRESDLREARLSGLAGFEHAGWIGVDVREADFRGGYGLRRFIADENYLEEFRTRSRGSAVVYEVWRISSDCGRSFTRWALWVLLAVAVFAALFSLVEVDYGRYPTPLSPVYYSIVTITTLGYGDVVPASTAGQLVAILEVIVGYLGLGGLISIFSNKIARRAD